MTARPTRAAAVKARAAANARRARAGSNASDSDVSVVVISDSESDGDAFDPAPSGATHGASPSPSPSVASSVLSTDSSEYDKPVGQGTKRKRTSAPKRPAAPGKKAAAGAGTQAQAAIVDIEDCVARPHARAYHVTNRAAVAAEQDALLAWFDGVRDTRGMPWRKLYRAGASAETKAQRAYEVWVSEVMLQQTQVSTVTDYWTRWIARWPTIADLAKADIEEVNAAWRGLGYYRRAKSLLEGAKTVMNKYGGQLPDDPDELEKGIPGVGRYTAGAICSIAYGIRTPIVDGNIHRVLTRLLALHASQTSPATIRFLWDTAEALIDVLPRGLSRGIAGDWNQALMELGATVCKPVNPECDACPLRDACAARREADGTLPLPPPVGKAECDVCEPLPVPLLVTSFPMKKVKKVSREENEVVVVTEWRSADGDKMWLLSKRPEKGLLAGLFEPPTTPVPIDTSATDLLQKGKNYISKLLALDVPSLKIISHSNIAPVTHIFSHINMTYHAQHLVISADGSTRPPTPRHLNTAWLDATGVEGANVGTGVKKVWAAVYGGWGSFEVRRGANTAKCGKVKAGKQERKVKPEK